MLVVLHACMPACLHACMPACLHARMPARMRACTPVGTETNRGRAEAGRCVKRRVSHPSREKRAGRWTRAAAKAAARELEAAINDFEGEPARAVRGAFACARRIRRTIVNEATEATVVLWLHPSVTTLRVTFVA